MVADKKQTPKWFSDPSGARLIKTEHETLTALLAQVYGYHLVFIGEPELSHLAAGSLIAHHVLLNPQVETQTSTLSILPGELDAIPIKSDSVDCVILAHTLESAQNPHEILREAYRILIPEGQIILTGLNPYSLWGLWYGTKRFFHRFSPEGKLLSCNRMKDWLQLLNFQIIESKMFHFRPPLKNEKFFTKLGFIEKVGHYCWPFWAGGYALQAVKRVVPLVPIRKKWREVEKIWQPVEGVVKPTTNIQTENQETL